MSDPETIPPRTSESSPLLESDRRHISTLRSSTDWIACHIVKIHGEESVVWDIRRALQRFLASKYGHYFVIFLVSADIAGIFADFLISLHICEHSGEKGFNKKAWVTADEVLDIVSLSFSCLFMAELVASIFAFGFGYFKSKFHCFDATVIVVGFVIDVLLHGTIEEAGSLIVVLRLWRVFKIIEEFSSGADDSIEELHERIEHLEREKDDVRKENEGLRMRIQQNGPGANGSADGGLK